MTAREVQLTIRIDSDEELSALEGALLAARAAELSKVRRRDNRLSMGYGSETARESMTEEIGQAQQRWTMLDRLLGSLKRARSDPRG